jgi:hypothetical protein
MRTAVHMYTHEMGRIYIRNNFLVFRIQKCISELKIHKCVRYPSKNLTDHKLGVTHATRQCYHGVEHFPVVQIYV